MKYVHYRLIEGTNMNTEQQLNEMVESLRKENELLKGWYNDAITKLQHEMKKCVLCNNKGTVYVPYLLNGFARSFYTCESCREHWKTVVNRYKTLANDSDLLEL